MDFGPDSDWQVDLHKMNDWSQAKKNDPPPPDKNVDIKFSVHNAFLE